MSEPDWLKKARAEGRILSETKVRTEGPPDPVTRHCVPTHSTFARPPADIPEEAFRRLVIDLARAHGWKVAAIRRVRVQRADGSVYYETPMEADGAGWPDLVLVRAGVILYVELKVARNKATDEQVAWLDVLRDTGAAAGVWRPADWDDIVKTLAGG